MATTLAKLSPLASDCIANRGLLVAQALLLKLNQLIAKLAQQRNFLSNGLASSMLLCLMNWIQAKVAGILTQKTLAL